MSAIRVPLAALPDDLPVHNNLVRTTYNNPEMHRGFASLSGRVHSASHLGARTRELVILQTAARLGAEYEWSNHVPGAKAAGVTDEEIAALGDGSTAPFTGADLVALRYAAAVEERTVDDALWQEAVAVYSPVELLDMTMVVAFYGLASRLVLALGVPLDG